MKMKWYAVAALVLVAAAGVLIAVVRVPATVAQVQAAVPASQAPAVDRRIAYGGYSTRCATPSGICTIDPQPVGSTCECDGEYGTVIP